MSVERPQEWPRQTPSGGCISTRTKDRDLLFQHPSAYLYVVYPAWVRGLQWVREKVADLVFYCEMKTGRFYDPRTGEPVERVQ